MSPTAIRPPFSLFCSSFCHHVYCVHDIQTSRASFSSNLSLPKPNPVILHFLRVHVSQRVSPSTRPLLLVHLCRMASLRLHSLSFLFFIYPTYFPSAFSFRPLPLSTLRLPIPIVFHHTPFPPPPTRRCQRRVACRTCRALTKQAAETGMENNCTGTSWRSRNVYTHLYTRH